MDRNVTSQSEFDAALTGGDIPVITNDGDYNITACSVVKIGGSSQPRVEAYGSSQPRVEAYGSSQPRVEAYGSSQPRVVAYGSSQPRVEAYGSSQPRVVAYGSSQPRVVAYGSSQPRVEAYGSSQPRVVAYGSSQPRVVAYGSSQPRVEAYGSSQPRVEAYGSSQPRVVAYGYAQVAVSGPGAIVTAGPKNQIQTDGKANITGGQVQVVEPIRSAAEWCEVYGVPVKDGVAILFKALDGEFMSPKGGNYTPGTTPVAADWDGGKEECGGGLHFSPRPVAALAFNREAVKFCGCPVALVDIAVHPNAAHPSKVKARGCCAPTWECDLDGNPVVVEQKAGA